MSSQQNTGGISHNMSLFEYTPIPAAVMTLAVPTIITQLINIIYNFADTWYVGRTGNAAMVAALSVCMPVFVLLTCPGAKRPASCAKGFCLLFLCRAGCLPGLCRSDPSAARPPHSRDRR